MWPKSSSDTAALMPLFWTAILEAIGAEKKEDVKKRWLEDEEHGAGEPVWKLKHNAHLARKALRDGERLARKIKKHAPYHMMTSPTGKKSCWTSSIARGCMPELIKPIEHMAMASRGQAISDFD